MLEASNNTPDVKGAYRNGLQAIKGTEKTKFQADDTRLFTGSIDIDTATKQKYPEESRWDYAIEYNGETFFVEVHPASTSEIDTVLAKLSWLKQWLKNEAPGINSLKAKSKPCYQWILTNSFNILKTSKQYKRLAQNGILPKRFWKYSEL